MSKSKDKSSQDVHIRLYCTQNKSHNHEPLSIVCLDPRCLFDPMICSQCRDINHKNHQTVLFKTLIQELKSKTLKTSEKLVTESISTMKDYYESCLQSINSLKRYLLIKLQKIQEQFQYFYAETMHDWKRVNENDGQIYIRNLMNQHDPKAAKNSMTEILKNITVQGNKIVDKNEEFFMKNQNQIFSPFCKTLNEILQKMHNSFSKEYRSVPFPDTVQMLSTQLSSFYSPSRRGSKSMLNRGMVKNLSGFNNNQDDLSSRNDTSTTLNRVKSAVLDTQAVFDMYSDGGPNTGDHKLSQFFENHNQDLSKSEFFDSKYFDPETRQKLQIMQYNEDLNQQSEDVSAQEQAQTPQSKIKQLSRETSSKNFNGANTTNTFYNASNPFQFSLGHQQQNDGTAQIQFSNSQNYNEEDNQAEYPGVSGFSQNIFTSNNNFNKSSSNFFKDNQSSSNEIRRRQGSMNLYPSSECNYNPINNVSFINAVNNSNNKSGYFRIDTSRDKKPTIESADFKFSKDYHHPCLEITNDRKVVRGTQDNLDNRLIICEPSIETHPQRQRFWKFVVKECKNNNYSCPLGLGVAYKSVLDQFKYEFRGEQASATSLQLSNPANGGGQNKRTSFILPNEKSNQNIDHGCFLLTSNGFLRVHNDKQNDMKQVQMRFVQGDIIRCHYNPFNKILRFFRNNNPQCIELKADSGPTQKLYPCVRLSYSGDIIQIVKDVNDK